MIMLHFKTWLLGCVVATVFSGGALGAVHEHLAAIPPGWSSAGSAVEEYAFSFTVALNREFEGLEEHLLDVSTPGSPHYGKFLDRTEVEALYPPPKDAVSRVVSWLKDNDISEYKVDGAFIDFVATAGAVNNLLNASYQYYRSGPVTKFRTLHYSVPDNLQKDIAFVDPGTFFGHAEVQNGALKAPFQTKRSPQAPPSKSTVAPSCQTSITPPCLKQLYNVGNYQADPESGSKIGFGSFLNQSALYADLAQFEKTWDIPSQNFTKVIIENGTDSQDPVSGEYGEANLDVQTIIGVSHPLPVTEFLTGGLPPFIPTFGQPTPADNQNEPYVPFYRYILSKNNSELPQVISQSYGDQEDGVPFDYATLTCNLIGILGLRGITVITSSGDGGLGGACLAPDFKTVEFGSVFPSSCPYLTAVGGTSDATPEVAWNASSGGFSRYFARPGWQNDTVATYLATQVDSATRAYYGQYTNYSGRAYPDVSAHSLWPNFQIVYGGEFGASGGTSASAPVVAALVGLLNDARLRAGKSALGWLNPLIYGVAKGAFIDITGGYTVGCRGTSPGSGRVPGARWNATVGWDPTTGFGTPDFVKLKEIVLGV